MQLILCLMIVVLCGYIGRTMSRRITLRLEFFREYQSAFTSLSDGVVGMGIELGRALKMPCGEKTAPLFLESAKRLKAMPQKRFAQIWKESYGKIAGDYPYLTREDEKMILDAGTSVEALCYSPSEKQAEGYIRRLSGYLSELEIEKRRKCKLYNTAGVLTGLFIALLVI